MGSGFFLTALIRGERGHYEHNDRKNSTCKFSRTIL